MKVRTYAEVAIKMHHAQTVGARAPAAPPGVAPTGAGAVTKPDQELCPTKLRSDTTMGK